MRMKIPTNPIQLSTPTVLLPLLLLLLTYMATFGVSSGQETSLLTTVTRQMSTIQMYANLLSLPAPDFGQFLATCPSLQRQVDARCRTKQLSCSGRCVVAWEKRTPSPGTCYCDPVCHVYRDCCWDFDLLCPGQLAEYERSFSHLTDVAVICFDDSKVIDSCGAANNHSTSKDHKPTDHKPTDHKPTDHKPTDHKPTDHKPTDHRDHREPIVVTEAGLYFTNRTTYYNCYKLSEGNASSQRNNSNNITFLDAVIHAEFYRDVDRKIVEDFFLTGRNKDQAVLKYNLFGKSQQLKRKCSRPFVIDCPSHAENQRQGCRTESLRLHVEDICSRQNRGMNQSDGSGGSMLAKRRSELLFPPSRDHHPLPFPPTKGDHSRRGFSNPLREPESDSSCDIMRQAYSSTVPLPHSKLVEIVANFEVVNNPEFKSSANTGFRESIVAGFRCQRDEPRDPCVLTANCITGFLPVGLRCGRPRLLSIFVRGIRRRSAIKDAIGLLLFNLGSQPQFAKFTTIPPSFFRQMEVEMQPRSMLGLVHLPIINSRGLVYTSRQISVTADVVATLMKHTQISKSIYELTVCFVTDIFDSEDTVLICDTMVAASTGVIQLKRHFVVAGCVHNSTLKLAEFKRRVASGTVVVTADEGNYEGETPSSINTSPSLMNAPLYCSIIIISIIGHSGLITCLP